ncbi:MAG TPA: hypothetical protein VGT44_22130, partial [Ktedonobacteraceae bacterium]|nr:hypothetical protein [Ktedonobacteraceae bacterium]
EGEGFWAGLQRIGQDRPQGNITVVRPLVVAPTEMQPQAIRRDIPHRLVECLDVQGAVVLAPVLTAYPADAEIGTIQLQEKAGFDDGVVFLLHCLTSAER